MSRYLDLSQNPVTDWHPNAFKDVSHSLKRANLASTGLTTFPALTQKNLRVLNLSHNALYLVDPQDLLYLRRLEALDLSYNRLYQFGAHILSSLPNLRMLNISGNILSTLDFRWFSSHQRLEALELNHFPSLVQVASATKLSLLPSLKHVSLLGLTKAGADFTPFSLLANLPPLESLRVELTEPTLKDQLLHVDTRILRHLHLASGGGQLRLIYPEALRNLRGHRFSLRISNSALTDIPSSLFHFLNRVRLLDLDLSGNRALQNVVLFQHTEPPFLNSRGTVLNQIRLHGTNLSCSCHLVWIKRWLGYRQGVLSRDAFRHELLAWNATSCTGPAGAPSIPILHLNFKAMACAADLSGLHWLLVFLVTMRLYTYLC